ncbi:unnamed protein product, partial [Staurois parvus]
YIHYIAKRIWTPLQIIGFRCSHQLQGHRCIQAAFTNIFERMGRSQELSEFKRGTVIVCHVCNKSICKIPLLLNIPWSAVSGIITKWKQLGTTATQPPSGRPCKMIERGQRMLKRTVHRSHQLSQSQ